MQLSLIVLTFNDRQCIIQWFRFWEVVKKSCKLIFQYIFTWKHYNDLNKPIINVNTSFNQLKDTKLSQIKESFSDLILLFSTKMKIQNNSIALLLIIKRTHCTTRSIFLVFRMCSIDHFLSSSSFFFYRFSFCFLKTQGLKRKNKV